MPMPPVDHSSAATTMYRIPTRRSFTRAVVYAGPCHPERRVILSAAKDLLRYVREDPSPSSRLRMTPGQFSRYDARSSRVRISLSDGGHGRGSSGGGTT